jgi:hypothetical protein
MSGLDRGPDSVQCSPRRSDVGELMCLVPGNAECRVVWRRGFPPMPRCSADILECRKVKPGAGFGGGSRFAL